MTELEKSDQIVAWAERIFRRADGLDDVVPRDHQPNWQDRPARSRLYPGVPHIPLLSPSKLGRAYQQIAAEPAADPPSLASLSVLLYLMAGPLSRKVDINWNADLPAVSYARQEYKRGTASGGGLYPVQLYLVASGTTEPGAGVYHYSNARHALVPIRHGEWSPALATAAAVPQHPYYLVIAVDFWTNCFKYHNFGYHVCNEDVGAMLGTLQMVCSALHIAHRASLVFDDRAVNTVIGADRGRESALAVVCLGEPLPPDAARTSAHDLDNAPVVPRPWQRSRRVQVPEQLLAVHELTLRDAPPAGTPRSEQPPACPHGPLDAVLQRSLPSVLVSRRSAWSSMHGPGPIAAADLHELLRFVSSRVGPVAPALREHLPDGSLEIALRVRAVADVAPGLYRWAHATESLEPLAARDVEGWQSTYSMNNYNIEEAAVMLFVLGRLRQVTDVYGARGYRLLNAYAGAAAQLTYTAAAALHLDCGVVLGVRAQRVKGILQLPPEQNVMLAVYLSRAQKRAELFTFHLLPDVPTWKPA